MDKASRVVVVRAIKTIVISISIAAVMYFTFSAWAGWREVASAVSAVGWTGLAIALCLSLASYGLKYIRWQLYLSALGQRLPAGVSAVVFVTGFALAITPFRLGEMLRGFFLQRRGVPFLRSTAIFMSERLSDLVAVILIAIPGVTSHSMGQVVVIVSAIAAVVIGLILLQADNLAHLTNWINQLPLKLSQLGHHVMVLLQEARRCHDLGVLVATACLSIAAWSAEACAFYLVLDWMNISLGIWIATSIFALSILAGALSFLPGGIGGAEAVMVFLLILNGANEPSAVAATVLIRLTTLWFAVALGLGTLVLGRRKLFPGQADGTA